MYTACPLNTPPHQWFHLIRRTNIDDTLIKREREGGERHGRHCPSIVDQGMYLDNKRGSAMNEESFLPFRGGNGGGPNPMPYLPARGRNGGPVYLLIIGKLRE